MRGRGRWECISKRSSSGRSRNLNAVRVLSDSAAILAGVVVVVAVGSGKAMVTDDADEKDVWVGCSCIAKEVVQKRNECESGRMLCVRANIWQASELSHYMSAQEPIEPFHCDERRRGTLGKS